MKCFWGRLNGILRGYNHVDFPRTVKFGDMLGIDLMHCPLGKTIIYKVIRSKS
jgi:hypothetical protein